MISQARRTAWTFWLVYAVLWLNCLTLFVPGLRLPHGLGSGLPFVFLVVLSFEWKDITMLQLYFSVFLGLVATGFGVYRLWNCWVVVPMVPCFLLFAVVLYFLARESFRRKQKAKEFQFL